MDPRPLTLCVLLAAPLWGQAAAPQSASTVEGNVANSLTGEPIRRAEVILRRIEERGQRSGNFIVARTAIGAWTDGSGNFLIEGLEPGRYSVEVQKNGFILPPDRRDSDATVTLAPGETKKGLRWTLLPQGVVTGTITDEEGEPVRGVSVTAMRTRYVRGRRALMQAATATVTNDRGEFRLTGLRAGRYFLLAQARDSRSALFRQGLDRPTAYVPTYFPGTSQAAQAQAVRASAGLELQGQDIRLRREPVFRITGTAVGPDGRPLANFTTLLNSADEEATTVAGNPSRQGDGRFEVQGLRSGTWIVSVQPMERGENERSAGVARVEVRGADVENIQVRVVPQLSFVTTFELEGSATPDWRKVQGSALATEPLPSGSGPARAVQADGTARLYVGAPGRYLLQATGAPVVNSYLASIRIGTDEYLGREVDFSQGAPASVRFLFRTDGAVVRGTVPESTAPAGRRLFAFLLPVDDGIRRLGGAPQAETGPGETFEFRNVRPGDYWLVVADESDASAYDLASEVADFESKATRLRAGRNGVHVVEVRGVVSVSAP